MIKYNQQLQSFALLPSIQVPLPARHIVDRLAQVGTTCQSILRLASYTTPSAGAIRQSLNKALLNELRTSYLESVARFEEALAGEEAVTLTLRRALVWFEKIKHKVDFILEILNTAVDLYGGAIISHLYQFHESGDAELAGIAQRVLAEILKPFYVMLDHFVCYGTLKDPYHEFFIRETLQSATEQGLVQWSEYYSLDESKLPSVLSLELAKKALLAGKTRAFIANLRREDSSLGSAMEIDLEDDQIQRIASKEDVESLVNREYQNTCEQLSRLLWDHYRLKSHFLAIRHFVHFGRGDFASSLIELIRYVAFLVRL